MIEDEYWLRFSSAVTGAINRATKRRTRGFRKMFFIVKKGLNNRNGPYI
jgi:hypothetical protein